jgi:hypothetical protein
VTIFIHERVSKSIIKSSYGCEQHLTGIHAILSRGNLQNLTHAQGHLLGLGLEPRPANKNANVHIYPMKLPGSGASHTKLPLAKNF